MLENTMQDEINWDEVNNPPEKSYDLFGKVEIKFWRGAFQKGTRGSVPFNPAVHQKSHIAIDIYIQPLAEIDVKYPKSLEFHDVSWSRSWAKIIIPSLKALGINDAREINDRWVRIAKVPDGGSYQRKDANGNLIYKPDGSPDMVETTTFNFVALYADEDACRAAYLAAGGKADGNANGNGHNVPLTNNDTEKQTAYQFLKVIVGNVARGKETFAEAQEAVGAILGQYPTVSKFYLANSVETGELITEVTGKLPF